MFPAVVSLVDVSVTGWRTYSRQEQAQPAGMQYAASVRDSGR